MGRCFLVSLLQFLFLFLCGTDHRLLWSVTPEQQDQPQKEQPPKPELQRQRKGQPTRQAIPEEEDANVKNQEYSFNPLQAQREVQTGNYYFKKGSYRAAAGRFREATHWNEGYAEAWLRLGEAEEKLKDPKEARDAYQKYLELASDSPKAPEIRKKLEKMK
jgi:tetratricopeptide (TPR) repeat protein